MKETNEKSLIIKNENFFDKILIFFKNIFSKKKNNYETNIEPSNTVKSQNKTPINNFQIDESWIKLKDIKNELSKNGINEENLKELIKDLTEDEKIKLKEMYVNQNQSLKSEIEGYKAKILAIKSEL